MAVLDRFTKRDRDWYEHARRCAETVTRAAGVQARQHGLRDPICAAAELVDVYGIRSKKANWQELGNVAFHLVARWPPDLAYVIVYALREVTPPLDYDPVPLVMKAIEMLPHLSWRDVALHLEVEGRVRRLAEDPDERARACAKVIARELSGVPFRWAAGIYSRLDQKIKPFVQEEVERFDPKAAGILLQGSWAWLLTGTGLCRMLQRIWHAILRVLFGEL